MAQSHVSYLLKCTRFATCRNDKMAVVIIPYFLQIGVLLDRIRCIETSFSKKILFSCLFYRIQIEILDIDCYNREWHIV